MKNGAPMARGRRHGRAGGFTLIEILIAAATTRAASIATDGALETRERVLATWAAENRVAELRARSIFPEIATTRLATEEGGLALVIDETVTETANASMRRIDLAVAQARDTQRVLTRITAYVSR